MLFGEVLTHIPQVAVMSTSLGTFPRPVPRPLPGVTLPASPECPSPQYWGWLWGGWSWSRSLTRGWSSVWSWVLALVGARCRGLCVGLLPRPLPGVTLPASPECPSPLCWGWLWGCRRVVGTLPAGGRRRCRWCVPHECSMSWTWLLAEVWVVLVVVAGVDGDGFVGVRCRGRDCWPRCGSW